FTPPLPVPEGSARAIAWSRPRPSKNQARDPLSFLLCQANLAPYATAPAFAAATAASRRPGGRTILASADEAAGDTGGNQILQRCQLARQLEAARCAAERVAARLAMPQRERDQLVKEAVSRATGLALERVEEVLSSRVAGGTVMRRGQKKQDDEDEYEGGEDEDNVEEDPEHLESVNQMLLLIQAIHYYLFYY
ncbi:unnamed protein product, partial [Protopolystoma xenopodis]